MQKLFGTEIELFSAGIPAVVLAPGAAAIESSTGQAIAIEDV